MLVYSLICLNCDNDFSNIPDGDKYWVDGFCSLSCKEEYLDRFGVTGKIVDITGEGVSFT